MDRRPPLPENLICKFPCYEDCIFRLKFGNPIFFHSDGRIRTRVDIINSILYQADLHQSERLNLAMQVTTAFEFPNPGKTENVTDHTKTTADQAPAVRAAIDYSGSPFDNKNVDDVSNT